MRHTLRQLLVLLLLGGLSAQIAHGQEIEDNGGRTIVSKVVPVYPELAKRMNIEGLVKLRVSVSPAGAAHTIEVIGGNPVLAKAGQDAVFKFRWAPAAQESQEQVWIRFHRPHN
jgi:outer membrane biosynthesis protein TonB